MLAHRANPADEDIRRSKRPLEARDGASIDVQRAEIVHVHLIASDIDNTGAKESERINVVEQPFHAASRI